MLGRAHDDAVIAVNDVRKAYAELLALFVTFYAASRRQPVDRLLDDLQLGEKRNAQTKNLSGGQRQRLSVALALVNDPEVAVGS